MLDKGQIKDWDGDPEDAPKPAAKPPEALLPEVGSEARSPEGRPPEARKDIGGMLMEAREAIPTGERVILTPEQAAARKRRGQWIAIVLFAFVIVIFVLTMSKVGGGIPVRM